ncbi:helicase associated domain-containing protein [Streptomyces sp. NPDC001948]
MAWSEQDAAWADGIAVAQQYATAHGHFLPPTTAVWEGHPIGVWAKNARAAARRARENEELRAAGLPVPSSAGAMNQARQEELDAIDPGGALSGTPGGSAAIASSRTTSRLAAPSPRSAATSSCRARISAGG